MTGARFDIDTALQRLVDETYRLLATLPLLALALQILDATALVGAVLGTAGVLGVAIGFAFKDTLENYLAGILMSLRQPFAPRDHVVIGGNEGLVVSMTSRATILMTPDGNHLRLPNALVFRSVMLNYTRNPSRRFELDVGIGVNEDLVLAQQIVVDELSRLDGVISKPPPRAYIAALGDSNVQLRFHGWVDQRTHDFLMVKSEAIRKVKLALEGQGIGALLRSADEAYAAAMAELATPRLTRARGTCSASKRTRARRRRCHGGEHHLCRWPGIRARVSAWPSTPMAATSPVHRAGTLAPA